MMKMDGRDSAECQNWEKKDIDVIIRIDLNEEKDKIVNSCPLPLSKGEKTWKRGENVEEGRKTYRRLDILVSERERVTSL